MKHFQKNIHDDDLHLWPRNYSFPLLKEEVERGVGVKLPKQITTSTFMLLWFRLLIINTSEQLLNSTWHEILWGFDSPPVHGNLLWGHFG